MQIRPDAVEEATGMMHDWTARPSSSCIIEFADDTSVVGFISNSFETSYKVEVEQLVDWCQLNNLSLSAQQSLTTVPP